jgi:hypothetical protein
VVLPGFAIYHIGIQTPEALLIEENQLAEERLNKQGANPGLQPSVENPAKVDVPLYDVLEEDE